MACSNCKPSTTSPATPPQTPPAFPTGYTGCALSSLRYALPPPLPNTLYELPYITDDGTIIYTKTNANQTPPPEINGYSRDPDDLWCFHPLWPECAMRIHGLTRKRHTGAINIVMLCNHPESPQQSQRLTHHDCLNCSLRFPRNDRQ